MQIDFTQRTARLSIGELAAFSVGPSALTEGQQGSWRTRVGVEWHQHEEKASREAGEQGRYEVPLKASLSRNDWTLELQGRIDQLIQQEDGLLIREVKTVSLPLPLEMEDLQQAYPAYFAQLGAYLSLYPLCTEETASTLQGELLFINIDDGIRQSLTDDQLFTGYFEEQVDALVRYLEEENNRKTHRTSDDKPTAFEELRIGQEGVIRQINQAHKSSPITFLQAPTGFGKTGLVLEYAIHKLIDGEFDRILYLTCKTSGQLQVMSTLDSLIGEHPGLHAVQVRSRDDLCSKPECLCDPNDQRLQGGDRWRQCGLTPGMFLEELLHQPERFVETGQRERICPYELMRATLPYADIWVGDINYLFAPRNQGLFLNQPSFELDQCLVIIDEAHNLHSRVADGFSFSVAFDEVESLHAIFQWGNSHPRVRLALETWMDFLEKLRPSESLTDLEIYECQDCAETLYDTLQNNPVRSTVLDENAVRQIWELAEVVSFFSNAGIERYCWCPENGRVNLTCTDASAVIAKSLKSTKSALLLSATLEPFPFHLKSCGLLREKPLPEKVDAHAPWRDGAYQLAIDTRVDTRYRQRNHYHTAIAETLYTSSRYSDKPIVAFFPSFGYAEQVYRKLDDEFPQVRGILQPRGLRFQDQSAFIEQALMQGDVIFLVLGSGFAEGVDLLGGRVEIAAVISPALPEVNPIQKRKYEQLLPLGKEVAFNEVYQIPGMQKIHQAVGRLVRQPGHRARLLFIGKRFEEASYRELIDPQLNPDTLIVEDVDLTNWLQA